ncbi:MAG: hypothetical protein BV456_00755 [Thermoplasmata archaeon M8B2D]|nr:MAG: hypothetical protein BV456_00755 [Thermoplasmata archaeon M8B2D]
MMIDNELRYLRLAIVDRIVSKTTNVSEITQIARTEKRIRSYLIKTWKDRIEKSYLILNKIKKTTKYKEIVKKINNNMNKWRYDVLKIYVTEIKNIYKLARIAGYKKATRQTKQSLRYGLPKQEIKKAKVVLPVFDLVDEKTIKALEEQQIFWIGELYDNGVSDRIAKTVKEAMAEVGLGPLEVSKILREKLEKIFEYIVLPSGFIGTPESYFSGLVANTFTVARVQGQVRSFMEIGITSYEINNPGDNRTCERCAHMDGKIFRTEDGANQMLSELKMKNPEDIKQIHPWLSLKELQKISPNPGYIGGDKGLRDSKKLSEAGLSLPPYHFKCRCTVDISIESSTFENLQPITLPI